MFSVEFKFKNKIFKNLKNNFSRPNEIRMISTFEINESGDVIQHVISDMEITKGFQWTRASSMAFIFGAFGARNGVPPPAFGEDSFLGYWMASNLYLIIIYSFGKFNLLVGVLF